MMNNPAPILSAFGQAFREARAGGAGALLPLSFFAGAATLVPFAVGSDTAQLSAIGAGVLWVALALASLVTMERLFQADYEDGALDLWIQSGAPLSAIAAMKVLAHWIVSGLPLVIVAPVLGMMLQMSPSETPQAALAYGIGGLAFFFWGGFGAALAATVRRGGLLIALIALPFYVPTAIFGAMSLQSDLFSGAPPIEFLLLCASTLFALAAAPIATAAALRLAAD